MNTGNPGIFFTDLDGTLLNSQKKIGDRTRRALEDFIAAGNYFAISTGRAMESAMAVQRELSLYYPRTFLIACNGAHVYDCDKKSDVYRIGIDDAALEKIFRLSKERGIHVHTYNDTHIVSPRIDTPEDREALDFYRRVIKTPLLLTDDVISEMTGPPGKCIAIELHDIDRLESFRKELSGILGSGYTLIYSYAWYLEIFRAEAGKGSAVTRLCEHLHIPVSNSIAAGDEENDISMIQAAGLGIAMVNGRDKTKSAADRVTAADNDHDGLAEFLENSGFHD